MRHSTLLIWILFLSPFTGLAQTDSFVVKTYFKKNPRILHEVYFINTDSVRQGNYQEYSLKGKVVREGRYESGKHAGIWTYYEDNHWHRVIARFDWTNLVEISYDNLMKEKPQAPILIEGKTEIVTLDTFCRFPGGHRVFLYYLDEKLELIDTSLYLDTTIHVEFVVNESGYVKVTGFYGPNRREAHTFENEELKNILVSIFEGMPRWFPHSVNGKRYGQSYIQPIRFELSDN